ncbi:hypothetical protein B0H19DRAFT_543874 [Mycena capillaripes]|nr:hypothetical protein B0H19DRAFT_543874 [Mycena capillaripes]
MSTHRIPPSSGVSYTDTPYKAFLHTNFVPSEDECRRIRDLVAHPKKELEETIKEIDHLRTTLGQLTAKRDRLAEFVDSHLALVSETRRLPNDIMGEIFLASLPNYRHISMAPAESPLLLTRICREWRSLALSMPRLWTSLRVIRPVTCQYITFQTTHVDRVQLWLQRSGGATGPPLSISYSPRRPSHQIVDTILQTLMEFSHRWEHVNFDLGYSGPLENLSRDDVPLLRTVIIDGGYWLDNNVVWVPCGDNTRSMSIRGSLQQTTQPVSSTSLVHLSLPSVSLTQALAILRQCFNLQTCTLALGNDPDNFPASEAFRMEFVRRLCVIDDTSTNSSVHLLEYLILPNLQCFESLHRTNSPP